MKPSLKNLLLNIIQTWIPKKLKYIFSIFAYQILKNIFSYITVCQQNKFSMLVICNLRYSFSEANHKYVSTDRKIMSFSNLINHASEPFCLCLYVMCLNVVDQWNALLKLQASHGCKSFVRLYRSISLIVAQMEEAWPSLAFLPPPPKKKYEK